jgi:hypothetical protein
MESLQAPMQITMDNPLNASTEPQKDPVEETTPEETCVCLGYCCWCMSGTLGIFFTQ